MRERVVLLVLAVDLTDLDLFRLAEAAGISMEAPETETIDDWVHNLVERAALQGEAVSYLLSALHYRLEPAQARLLGLLRQRAAWSENLRTKEQERQAALDAENKTLREQLLFRRQDIHIELTNVDINGSNLVIGSILDATSLQATAGHDLRDPIASSRSTEKTLDEATVLARRRGPWSLIGAFIRLRAALRFGLWTEAQRAAAISIRAELQPKLARLVRRGLLYYAIAWLTSWLLFPISVLGILPVLRLRWLLRFLRPVAVVACVALGGLGVPLLLVRTEQGPPVAESEEHLDERMDEAIELMREVGLWPEAVPASQGSSIEAEWEQLYRVVMDYAPEEQPESIDQGKREVQRETEEDRTASLQAGSKGLNQRNENEIAVVAVDTNTATGSLIAANAIPLDKSRPGGAGAVACPLPLAVPDCYVDTDRDGAIDPGVEDMLFDAGACAVDYSASTGQAYRQAFLATVGPFLPAKARTMLDGCPSTLYSVSVGDLVGRDIYLSVDSTGLNSSTTSTSPIAGIRSQISSSTTSLDGRWSSGLPTRLVASDGPSVELYGHTVERPVLVVDVDDSLCAGVDVNASNASLAEGKVIGFLWGAIYDVQRRCRRDASFGTNCPTGAAINSCSGNLAPTLTYLDAAARIRFRVHIPREGTGYLVGSETGGPNWGVTALDQGAGQGGASR